MIPTKAILRTANIKALTVLGIIPVEIETMSADKETQVKAKIMLYVVEELRYTIISKVTLEDLDIILKYFPQPHGVQKSICDAWNGYHSVTIREEDRHQTTFLSPEG